MRPLVAAALAIAALVAASARHGAAPTAAPPRFPVQVLSPGDVPALWVFVRAECPPCHRHVRALQDALAGLDAATRARAGARIHLVGDVPCGARTHRHARHWLRRLGIATTPLTWWVAVDSTVARAWRGPRDAPSWRHALVFVLGESP